MDSAPLPLDGVVVVDASRMLPGAVLARMLLDLGASVIKLEDPRTGDLMRYTPPMVGGVGVGFAVYHRGAESIGLDLRGGDGAAAFRALAARVDVLIESFRPGTLERWGLDPEALTAEHPGLVRCSLPGFSDRGSKAGAVGHDMNFAGITGALPRLKSAGVPDLQLADVTAGTLACTAIVAALLRRARTGRGCSISQPLLSGPLHFLTWAWIEAAAAAADGQDPAYTTVLGGHAPCYRRYRCGDGLELSVGCLEPKFWVTFAQRIGLPELMGAGLDAGPDGQAAAARVEARLGEQPREHWLSLVAADNLPIAPIHTLDAARQEPALKDSGLLEQTPLPGGASLDAPGPSYPSLGRTPTRPAPRLGEHTRAVLEEFGLDPELIARLAP